MKQISLRLPDDLHAALKDLAEMERRSLHAEVLRGLERHVEREAEAIARGAAELDAGQGIPGDEIIAKYRRKR